MLCRTLTVKVTDEQYERVKTHAASRGVDPSVVLREFIDGIDADEERLRQSIDFHQYEQDRLRSVLDGILARKKKEEQESLAGEKTLKLERERARKAEKIVKAAEPVFSQVCKEFEKNFALSKEEQVKSRPKVLEFTRKCVKGLGEDVALVVFDDVNRFFLGFTGPSFINEREKFKEVIRGNTVG